MLKAMGKRYRIVPVLCHDNRTRLHYVVRWKIQHRVSIFWLDYTDHGEVMHFSTSEIDDVQNILAQASKPPVEIPG